jgi:hypothetical protein
MHSCHWLRIGIALTARTHCRSTVPALAVHFRNPKSPRG